MKAKFNSSSQYSFLTVAILLLALSFRPAFSQGAAFTYQGRLLDQGTPANGAYDFTFTLADAATEGGLVAGPLTNAAVAVTNGSFTVLLDFGAASFDGSSRWLELGVRTNGSTADFAILSPRQVFTAVPYALYASSAGTAATATNVASGGSIFASIQGTNIQAGTLNSNAFDTATLSLLAPGTSASSYSVYVLPNSLTVITNTLLGGIFQSTNLTPATDLVLDLAAADMVTAVVTQSVNISARLNPKPFWLSLSNGAPGAVALNWPAKWLWTTPAPSALTNGGDRGLLAVVCDGNSNVFASWSVAVPVVDPDAADYISRAGLTNEAEISAAQFLVKSLKGSNLWNKADAVYPFLGGTATSTAANLLSSNYAVSWSGSGVEWAPSGVTGDGLSGFGQITGFSLAKAALYGSNSASLFVYIGGPARPSNGGYFLGAYTDVSRVGLKFESNSLVGSGPNNDQPDFISIVTLDARGPVVLSRTAPNLEYLGWRSQILQTNSTATTTALPDLPCTLLARVYQNFTIDRFSNANLRGAWLGSGLSPAEAMNLMKIFEAFNTRLGRQAP